MKLRSDLVLGVFIVFRDDGDFPLLVDGKDDVDPGSNLGKRGETGNLERPKKFVFGSGVIGSLVDVENHGPLPFLVRRESPCS